MFHHFKPRFPCIVVFFIVLFFAEKSSGQTYNSGAKFLTSSQYAALPRPNWDTLNKYSNPGGIASITTITNGTGGTSGKITMLVNPPIGNQGIEVSCVGWAAGYSAMGILTYPK